jgi:hypothetical protein
MYVPILIITLKKKKKMPIPNPQQDETRKEYVERCMGDTTMVDEYPDNKQRFAVCNVQWRKSLKG